MTQLSQGCLDMKNIYLIDDAKALGEKIQIGSKQPKNLQRLEGGFKDKPAARNQVPGAGCKKCGRCKVSFPILNESSTFKSTNTGKI